jgi:hypothetical protein
MSDLRGEVAALGGRLDALQSLIERVLLDDEDGEEPSDAEALTTLEALAALEDEEEQNNDNAETETGEATQADGNTREQNGAERGGGEHSADESPRASHIWWRTIRN